MQCTYCCFAGVNQNGLLDFLLTITIALAHLLPSHQEAACLHCVIHLSTSCLHPKLVASVGTVRMQYWLVVEGMVRHSCPLARPCLGGSVDMQNLSQGVPVRNQPGGSE